MPIPPNASPTIPPGLQGSYGVNPITDYGAVSGQDSTVAIAKWAASGGGTIPIGVWLTSQPVVITENGQTIAGEGRGSILRANASMGQVLQVKSGSGLPAVFSNFQVDGNGLTTNAASQSIPVETSVGTRWENCHFRGSSSYQMLNQGCEDVTYFDCSTDGNEGAPLTVAPALSVSVPGGSVRIIGGEWFGECLFEYQIATAAYSTIGPIVINNPNALSSTMLKMDGCYMYDGGAQSYRCIDTATNLSNIQLNACFIDSEVAPGWINGNLPSGVTIAARDCLWVQGSSTAQVMNLLTASGAGTFMLSGGGMELVSGSSANAINRVSGGTTQVVYELPTAGITPPTPTVAALAANGTSPPAPTITGTDSAGVVSFGSGTSPAVGAQVQVTFATAKATAPIVIAGPYAASDSYWQGYVVPSSVTTTGFQYALNTAPSAGEPVGTMAFSYLVVAS